MTVTHYMTKTRVRDEFESLQKIPVVKTNWIQWYYCGCGEKGWHKEQLIILHVCPCVINQVTLLRFTTADYSLTSGTVQYVTFTVLMMLLPVLLHTGVFFLHVYYSEFWITSRGLQLKNINPDAVMQPYSKWFLYLQIHMPID